MSTEIEHGKAPELVGDLFARLSPRRAHSVLAWVLAIASHAAVGLFAFAHPAQANVVSVPLEVELLAPPPPPPLPEPEPEPEAAAPVPAVVKPVPAKPPAAAKAGAILTANPDPEPTPTQEEPFDFTNDPNSAIYGAGVVAVGGTATYGVAGAKVGGEGSTPIVPALAGDGLTAAADLSRSPRLPADACRGFFPKAAIDEAADVEVRVTVSKTGAASNVQILSESKTGQGFGAAAKRCLLDKRFESALDKSGAPAATSVRVKVRFSLR